MKNADDFTKAYIGRAIHSVLSIPFDSDISAMADRIRPDVLFKMAQDCKQFQHDAEKFLLVGTPTEAGRLFWDARMGTGKGFKEENWPPATAQMLQQLAHSYPREEIYCK